MLIFWCPAILPERRNWHMCDVTSLKWGVTSLQLVDLVEPIKQIAPKLLSETGKPGANLLNIIYSRPFVAINRALQPSQTHRQWGVQFFQIVQLKPIEMQNLTLTTTVWVSDFWCHKVQSWSDCDPSANTHFISSCNSISFHYKNL